MRDHREFPSARTASSISIRLGCGIMRGQEPTAYVTAYAEYEYPCCRVPGAALNRFGCDPGRSGECRSALSLEQLVEGDRQVAHAFASRVKYRVGHGSGGAGDADLADAVRTERRMLVGNIIEENLDVGNIEIDGNVIFGQRRIHDAAAPFIEQCFLA